MGPSVGETLPLPVGRDPIPCALEVLGLFVRYSTVM